MRTESIQLLAQRARASTLYAIYHAKSGHPGGSLSCVDLLTYLYKNEVNEREDASVILSKGHAVPATIAG